MLSFNKIFSVSRQLGKLCFNSQFVSQKVSNVLPSLSIGTNAILKNNIHTTSTKYDLMEFFDNKKNWGENEVKHGRAWIADELRLKSNGDLHKLWYVLLKERNMLLTMEHESNESMQLFPSPERLDKVKKSMENIETVVRERNKAYHLLETGETGERPGRLVHNQLGLKFYYREFQHIIPKFMNNKWRESHKFYYGGFAVRKFLRLYREKLYNVKRKQKNRDRNHVMQLLRRYPNLDKEMLSNKYPSVDIQKLVRNDQIRGHNPKTEEIN